MPSNERAKSFIRNEENSKKYFKEIWEKFSYGMAFVAIDGSWLKVNPYLCEILEYTESELLNRNFQQITHPEDLYDDQEMLEKLHEGKIDNYTMSKRYITKTGKVIWIKLKVTRIMDENGEMVHYLTQVTPTIIIDSPENHRIQSDLLELANRLNLLNKLTLIDYIKKNWKFILSSTLLVSGFIINQVVSYREYQTKANNAQIEIEKLRQEINLIKSDKNKE